MDEETGLVATFLAHAKGRFGPLPEEEAAELETLLDRAWKEARARWPAVELPVRRFVSHVAERLTEEGAGRPIAQRVAGMSLTELYLACACLQGLAPAHEAFERDYLAQLTGKLRSSKQSNALLDDVRQIARVKFLVATPESGPRIEEYMGRGALMSWVVVTAGRIATRLEAAEKPRPGADSDELLKMLPGQGADPELDVMKRRHQGEFRQAVREAFATLSAEDRYLLRLHFAEGLSTHELAKHYGVNQSTISRWLKSARQQVYEETRSRLQERLGLSTPGFESFLALVNSQLDLSLSQILGDPDDDAGPEDGG